jgi:diaminopimelate decarboxylase/aspartate kinase
MREKNIRPWVVMKFGGTSVSSADCWNTIVGQARRALDSGHSVMIVVSALSGMTNALTRLASGLDGNIKPALLQGMQAKHLSLFEKLGLEPSARFQEHWKALEGLVDTAGPAMTEAQQASLLALGELLSSSLGQQILESAGLQATWQDARGLLRCTEETAENYLSARCSEESDATLAGKLQEQGSLHITQGFIAANGQGETCLLGRGGSDTSAAYLAARLAAAELEIWTDVPGIFSADPRTVPEARLLRHLSYSEAQELASMGAKVLHPPSIQPARRYGIPVSIRDTNQPGAAGTRIADRRDGVAAQVKGVVSRENITMITMENPAMWQQAGFLADIFTVFKRHDFSVDLVSTSESTVTVSLDPMAPARSEDARMKALIEELERFCRVVTRQGCVSISLVGNAIRTILGHLSAAFGVFDDSRVHMVTQSANDLNLTLVIDSENAGSLVRELHRVLIGSQVENRPEFGPSWADLTHQAS